MYKEWKLNIRNLTELIWKYIYDEKEFENRPEIRKEIFELFDILEGPEENYHHVQDIRNKIIRDMDADTFNAIEVASYTRDLVFYGYR